MTLYIGHTLTPENGDTICFRSVLIEPITIRAIPNPENAHNRPSIGIENRLVLNIVI